MLLWMNPITNRTKNDVYRVAQLKSKGWQNLTTEEKNEFLSDMKGALNVSDIERILNNILILAEVLEISITIPEIPNPLDKEFLDELLNLVSYVSKFHPGYSTTPKLPSAPLNSYDKWNDIEKILEDIYTILTNNFYYYCGEQIFSGEEIGLLL